MAKKRVIGKLSEKLKEGELAYVKNGTVYAVEAKRGGTKGAKRKKCATKKKAAVKKKSAPKKVARKKSAPKKATARKKAALKKTAKIKTASKQLRMFR